MRHNSIHIKECLTFNELSAAINVKERARAGDSRGKAEVQAHQVEVKSVRGSGKPNFKNQPQIKMQGKKMKKKEDIVCFVCGVAGHKANHCRNRKSKGPSPAQHKGQKVKMNIVLDNSSSEGVKVMICPNGEQSRCFSTCDWTSLLEAHFRQNTHFENVLYVSTMTRNLMSESILCRQGIKLVFESNKVVLTKFGTFVGNDSGGMFRLSILDFNNANIFNVFYCNKLHDV